MPYRPSCYARRLASREQASVSLSGAAFISRFLVEPTVCSLIGGHEGAGYIVAIKDETSILKVGQNVGIKWIASSCNVRPPLRWFAARDLLTNAFIY
jgi:hypothetical protein